MRDPDSPPPAAAASIDPSDVARFSAIAAEWWDPNGKFRPLHKFNPVRLGFIRDHLCRHFDRPTESLTPFTGLRLLDIGCGGGLLAEPMARLGASVVGVDASEKNIKTAAVHAAESGLAIDYRAGAAEDLARGGERFDVVLNMEVVEHVADLHAFLTACGAVLNPGGLMIVATLNRTPKAYALAIIGAERVLRWLPAGTHSYAKFVRPTELQDALDAAGLLVTQRTGVVYDPLGDRWRLSRDMDVNYMVVAEKPA